MVEVRREPPFRNGWRLAFYRRMERIWQVRTEAIVRSRRPGLPRGTASSSLCVAYTSTCQDNHNSASRCLSPLRPEDRDQLSTKKP